MNRKRNEKKCTPKTMSNEHYYTGYLRKVYISHLQDLKNKTHLCKYCLHQARYDCLSISPERNIPHVTMKKHRS